MLQNYNTIWGEIEAKSTIVCDSKTRVFFITVDYFRFDFGWFLHHEVHSNY